MYSSLVAYRRKLGCSQDEVLDFGMILEWLLIDDQNV